MTPQKRLQKLERRAVRAALFPLLTASLPELAGPVPLAFLSELARALLKYQTGSRAQRKKLIRIVMQPAATDGEFLRVLLTSWLTPRAPSSRALH